MHIGETVRSRREEYAEATYEALLDSASACFFRMALPPRLSTTWRSGPGSPRGRSTTISRRSASCSWRCWSVSRSTVWVRSRWRARPHPMRGTGSSRPSMRSWRHLRSDLPEVVLGGGPVGAGVRRVVGCGERYEIEVIRRLLRRAAEAGVLRGRGSRHAGPRPFRGRDRGRPGHGPFGRPDGRAPAVPYGDAGRHGRSGAVEAAPHFIKTSHVGYGWETGENQTRSARGTPVFYVDGPMAPRHIRHYSRNGRAGDS